MCVPVQCNAAIQWSHGENTWKVMVYFWMANQPMPLQGWIWNSNCKLFRIYSWCILLFVMLKIVRNKIFMIIASNTKNTKQMKFTVDLDFDTVLLEYVKTLTILSDFVLLSPSMGVSVRLMVLECYRLCRIQKPTLISKKCGMKEFLELLTSWLLVLLKLSLSFSSFLKMYHYLATTHDIYVIA